MSQFGREPDIAALRQRYDQLVAERNRRRSSAQSASRAYLGRQGQMPGQDIMIGPEFERAAREDPMEVLVADRVADYQTRAARGELNLPKGTTPEQLRRAAIGELQNEARAGQLSYSEGSTVPEQVGAYRIATNQYTPDDIRAVEAANQRQQREFAEAGAEQFDQVGRGIAQGVGLGGLGLGEDIGAGVANLARASDFTGAGTAMRNYLRPELRGVEEAALQRNPTGGVVGQLGGSLLPVGGAATGSAILTRRLLGLTKLGPRARAAGSAAGAFVGGELAQGPIAYQQVLNAGGTQEEALEATKRAAAAYPLIAGKLVRGEELDEYDALDLAMLVPELFGAGADLRAATRTPESLQQAMRTAQQNVNKALRDPFQSRKLKIMLLRDLENSQRALQSTTEAAQDALRPGSGGEFADVQPSQRFELEGVDPEQQRVARQLEATQEAAPIVDTDPMSRANQLSEQMQSGDPAQDIGLQQAVLDQLEAADEFPDLVRTDTLGEETLAQRQARRRAGETVEPQQLLTGESRRQTFLEDRQRRQGLPNRTEGTLPDTQPRQPRAQNVPRPSQAEGPPVSKTEETVSDPGEGTPLAGAQQEPQTPEAMVRRAEQAIRDEGGRVTEKAIYDRVKGQGLTYRQVREARRAPRAQQPISEEPPAPARPPRTAEAGAGPSVSRQRARPRRAAQRADSGAEPPPGPPRAKERGEFARLVDDRGKVTVQQLRRSLDEVGESKAGNRKALEDRLKEAYVSLSPAQRADLVRQIEEASRSRPARGRPEPPDRTSFVEMEEAPGPKADAPDAEGGGQLRAPQVRAEARSAARDAVKPESPPNIIDRLSDDLNIGRPQLGRDNLLKGQALGFYRAFGEVVALRHHRQLETAIHEVGHHLHKVLFQDRKPRTVKTKKGTGPGLDADAIPKLYHDELKTVLADTRPTYAQSVKPDVAVKEGWADFVRLVFTGNEADAKRLAPMLYDDFIGRLGTKYPKEYEGLRRFQKSYQIYVESPAYQKAMTAIAKRSLPLKTGGKSFLRLMRTWFNDDHFPMVRYMQAITADQIDPATGRPIRDPEQRLNIDNNPVMVARRVNGRMSGDLAGMVHGWRFDPNNHRLATGKPLGQIVEPVMDHLAEWETYMVLHRMLEKRSQGYKGLLPDLSDADMKQAISDLDAQFPAFATARKEFQEFDKWFMEDYVVGMGLLTKDQAKRIREANLDYITFRPVDIDSSGKAGVADRYVSVGKGISRFKQDSKGVLIEPPLSSYLMHLEGIVSVAQRNKVGQAMVNLANNYDRSGVAIRKVNPDMQAQKVGSDTVSEALRTRMISQGAPEEVVDQIMDIIEPVIDLDGFTEFRPAGMANMKDGMMYVWRDGKREFYQVVDPFVRQFLAGELFQPQMVPVFSQMTRLFKATVTSLNPEFFTFNNLRDLGQAMVYAAYGNTQPFKRIKSVFKEGYAEAMRGVWNEQVLGKPRSWSYNDILFEMSGAAQSGMMREYTRRDGTLDAQKMLGPRPVYKPIKEGDYKAAIRNLAGRANPLETFYRLNDRLEQATRQVEFELSLRSNELDKYKPDEALYFAGQAAADITLDFQRGGSVSKQINEVIPFFNAAMLGGDKLVRYIAKHPREFVTRSAMFLGTPALIEFVMNKDDEAYWKIPYKVRDRYFHLPIGENDNGVMEYFRFPKPYGLAVVPNLISRVLARNYAINPIDGTRGDPKATELKGLATMVMRDFMLPTTLVGVGPVVELIANYSMFYGGDIVRGGEQYGPIEERGAERSSEFAQTFGQILDVEPPKIDYAIDQYVGQLGAFTNQFVVSPAIKTVRESVMDEDARPSMASRGSMRSQEMSLPIMTWPVLQRFFAVEPRSYNEVTIRFYDEFNGAEEIYQGYSRRVSAGRTDAEEYYDKHRYEIKKYMRLSGYKSIVDQNFRQIRRLHLDPEPGEEDVKKLDELYRKNEEIMQRAMISIRSIEPEEDQE